MRPNRPSLYLAIAAASPVYGAGCSTIVTKSYGTLQKEEPHRQRGLGQPYTGVRCGAFLVPVYMAFPPIGSVIALGVILDLPLSLVADTMILPIDLVAADTRPWDTDKGCGASLH